MTLEQFFAENREVAIAFSGGVDSAYLLYAATRYAARVKAYYVSTAFQPAFELEDARRLADELGADMLVLHVDVLSNSAVTANPSDRCYHCKNTLFRQILRAAENDGFPVLLDGTNASDDAGDRPGMRAGTVRSLSPPGVRPDQSGDPPSFQRSRAVHMGQARLRLPLHPDTHRGGNHASKAEADGKSGRISLRTWVPGFPCPHGGQYRETGAAGDRPSPASGKPGENRNRTPQRL